MEKKTSTIVTTILSIAVFILLVITGQMTWQQFGEKGIETVSTLIDEDGSVAVLPVGDEITISNGIQTFTSTDLGIRFRVRQYLDQANGSILVRRSGHSVLVSASSLGMNNGQSIQVFEKGAGEDLLSAVKRQFLSGVSPEDCNAVITGAPTTSSHIGPTYQIVQIQLPVASRDDPEKMIQAVEKCPRRFTTTNGIAYFISDSRHPTQFAFFDIGQYPIEAEGDLMWQDTLEFLR